MCRLWCASSMVCMTNPIVVGYDAASGDRAPVDFGVVTAKCTGAPLIVAFVKERDAAQPAAVDAAQTLDTLEQDLQSHGVALGCVELEHTSAARALHEAAEREGAALLVVGSTRRGALGRVLPGSTAERLMHGAPCAIAIVPAGWESHDSLETIAVAYTDTPEGRAALEAAHALARAAGAKLRVITVAHVGLGRYAETEARRAAIRGKDFDEVEGEHRLQAEDAARAAVAALDSTVDVEVDAFLEEPADALIRVSEHVDLMVCGSRGYGPLRAVLLGGVSRRVAAEASCPVIVLPRGIEASLESLTAAAPAGERTS
jgi:nucleotide-binding universal stress UspA family protein